MTVENLKKDMFVFCTSCGEKNNIGAKFCQNCGTPLEAANRPRQDAEPRKEEHNYQSTYSEQEQEFTSKIVKCPNCGEVLSSFDALCPSCGCELRGAKANSSLEKLSMKLEAIDSQPDNFLKGTFLKRFTRESSEKEKQKIDLIRNYPIPNTKEDLYEFLIMALSNINTEYFDIWSTAKQLESEKALSDAWKAKYEQAYHKANFSFGNSREFQELNKTYLSKMKKRKQKKRMFYTGYIILVIILIIVSIGMFCYMVKDSSAGQKAVDKENERLELILDDIQQYIEEGEYGKARSLNATLVFNASVGLQSAVDSKKYWDGIRKELYDVIENAQDQDSGDTKKK